MTTDSAPARVTFRAPGGVPGLSDPVPTGIRMIHVSRLHPNPANRRKRIGDVSELAASIRVHGILQPIIAEHRAGRYVLIAGHRRLAAAKLAGLEMVRVDVRPAGGHAARDTVLMVVENCQREDFTAIEKAEALGDLRDGEGWTLAQISNATGLGQSTVSRYLALLDLDEESRDRVSAGKVKIGDALNAVRDARAQARRSAAPRPSGSAVKARKTAKPVRLQPRWLVQEHPLAAAAALRCGHDDRPRVGGVSCGQCWEEAIRADERARIARPAAEGQARDAC